MPAFGTKKTKKKVGGAKKEKKLSSVNGADKKKDKIYKTKIKTTLIFFSYKKR